MRVVCATHRDLQADVRTRRFRQDLLFRIGGFTVAVPPLRDRRAEIIPLAEHFARVAAAAARALGLSRRALIYKMEKYGLKPPPARPPARAGRPAAASSAPGRIVELFGRSSSATVPSSSRISCMARQLDPADLPEHVARYAQAQVDAGRFASIEDVLSAGVEALQERDRSEQEWLAYARKEAEDGFAALDRDEGIRGTAAEHMVRIDAAVRARSDRRTRE